MLLEFVFLVPDNLVKNKKFLLPVNPKFRIVRLFVNLGEYSPSMTRELGIENVSYGALAYTNFLILVFSAALKITMTRRRLQKRAGVQTHL